MCRNKTRNQCESKLTPSIVASSTINELNKNLMKEFRSGRNRKNTKGFDGISRAEYKKLLPVEFTSLSSSILNGTYEPQPTLLIEIPKEGKATKREIISLSSCDIAVARLLATDIESRIAPILINTSFSFQQSVKDQIDNVINLIHDKPHFVISMDIQKCYDRIRIKDLIGMISEYYPSEDPIIPLFVKLITADKINSNRRRIKYKRGIGQGNPFSSILCELYLNLVVDQWCIRKGYNSIVRYVDDFVVFLPTNKDCTHFINKMCGQLGNYGLKFKPNLRIINLKDQESILEFLGIEFIIQDGGLFDVRIQGKRLQSSKERAVKKALAKWRNKEGNAVSKKTACLEYVEQHNTGIKAHYSRPSCQRQVKYHCKSFTKEVQQRIRNKV